MDYQPTTEPCIAGQAGEKDIYTDDSDFTLVEERLIYGWKEGKRHAWFNGRKERNILRWKKPDRSPEHPTMKPIGMMKYLIRNSSRRNALVVDFFGGSGSTLIAAEETGRRCNTIEFDPKYADVIRKRYTKLALSKGMTKEQIGNGYLE
jgi:site-specific DNA-methyltransferase (adenine-specific)